jgi:large subunit ribosomal protein L9
MAHHVQVILKEDVDHLGLVGEVVRVRAGYARNYLVPQGLALPATAGSIKKIEHEKRLALAKADKMRAEAQGVAKGLEGLSLQIVKKAGDTGKLYGSVNSSDVAAILAENGHEIDRKRLTLPAGALKQAGEYEIGVKLGAGVTGSFKLTIVADAPEAEAVEAAPSTDA